MDANSRNPLWDNSTIGRKTGTSYTMGKHLVDAIQENDMCIHNSGVYTPRRLCIHKLKSLCIPKCAGAYCHTPSCGWVGKNNTQSEDEGKRANKDEHPKNKSPRESQGKRQCANEVQLPKQVKHTWDETGSQLQVSSNWFNPTIANAQPHYVMAQCNIRFGMPGYHRSSTP